MKPGFAEKEKAAKPPSLENSLSRQLNGRPKIPRVDSFSRFSDPPAPPPQQPLPEKPDAPRNSVDTFSPLKRSDGDRSKLTTTSSPVSRDSSQILSLLEALSSAKRELDTQSVRIKELEDLYLQEKAARESAEEKVKNLELRIFSESVEDRSSGEIDSSSKNESGTGIRVENIQEISQSSRSVPLAKASADSEVSQFSESAEVGTVQLQQRLESMMEEMEEMRKQMASLKNRAENAENETALSQKSLAELIEDRRRERDQMATAATATTTAACKTEPDARGEVTGKSSLECSPAAEKVAPGPSKKNESGMQHPDPTCLESQEIELDAAALALTTQFRRRGLLEEASPFASAFGVVLLGVGLMAYLNGWQKMDK